MLFRIGLFLGAAVLLVGCCGARASGRQYNTPNGVTAYIKCRSDVELCYEQATLYCGSRDFVMLSQTEELGGACSPSWGVTYTWYKMNIRCNSPQSRRVGPS